MNAQKQTTHFGNREVPIAEKAKLVADVFHSVAPQYDLMNDLMSFGLHRLWKRFILAETGLRPGQMVLDVAAGTGDLTRILAKQIGTGRVVMTDINAVMLQTGRDRLIDAGMMSNLECIQADAEHLPFASNTFDCITIAFGLRNVTNIAAALQSMYRVLKPGGKVLILEFSRPTMTLLNKFYDAYSFHVIPKIGEWVTHDSASYQYLVESIRQHPNQETLKAMLLTAGFADNEYINLTGGIVALHKGYKY